MLVGGSGVGKTALAQMLVYREFPSLHHPTIVDGYEKHFVLGDFAARISIVDSGGGDEYVAEVSPYLSDASGFIFVVDVTNPDSLGWAAGKYGNLKALRPDFESLPIALIGTKIDSPERIVTADDLATLASAWNCPWVETSAQEYSGVEDAFSVLVERLVPADTPATV